MSSRSSRLSLLLAGIALVGAQACSRSQNSQKTPLGQMPAAGSTSAANAANAPSTLSPAARTALDQGNTEFRAGHYDNALKAYRDAAVASPNDAAPYFGIYMAATKLGNKALADSANQAIAARNGAQQMLSDSTMQQLHQGAASAASTKAAPSKTGK